MAQIVSDKCGFCKSDNPVEAQICKVVQQSQKESATGCSLELQVGDQRDETKNRRAKAKTDLDRYQDNKK